RWPASSWSSPNLTTSLTDAKRCSGKRNLAQCRSWPVVSAEPILAARISCSEASLSVASSSGPDDSGPRGGFLDNHHSPRVASQSNPSTSESHSQKEPGLSAGGRSSAVTGVVAGGASGALLSGTGAAATALLPVMV